MFREAPRERLEKVYFSESFYEKHREALTRRIQAEKLDYEILDDHVFKTVSDTQTPQGVLCIVRQQESSLECIFEGGKAVVTAP